MPEIGPVAAVDGGLRDLDSQHHVQLDLLAAYCRAVEQASPAEESREILDRLVDFTRVHFSSEQMLMRLYAYPDYQVHLAEHEQTMESLAALSGAPSGEAEAAVCLDTAQRLRAAISGHVHAADRAFGAFLVQTGNSAR